MYSFIPQTVMKTYYVLTIVEGARDLNTYNTKSGESEKDLLMVMLSLRFYLLKQ